MDFVSAGGILGSEIDSQLDLKEYDIYLTDAYLGYLNDTEEKHNAKGKIWLY